ncbi:MAG: DNA replication/repair protein RecF [Phototrophicales bacterium]|nr:MAG: DNA replication/repair protein RecF [Phototrophicales bacterium]
MHIEHLSLKNFRNYTRLELSIPPNVVIIHGENAQGKTSLLEAIYYLATASSPYTNSDRQLMNWRVAEDYFPFAQVAADVISADNRLNRIEITLSNETLPDGSTRFRKVVKINGNTKRNLDLQGLIGVVLFLPQDMALVEGGPALRRRYLDLTLCQVSNTYAQALNDFDRVLQQRNALLKRISENLAHPDELDYWDAQITQSAAIIIAYRQRIIRELEIVAKRIHRELSGGLEDLELVYQPSFEPTAEEDGQQSFAILGMDWHRQLPSTSIASQYQTALKSIRADEIRRGMTLIGPQRDDMRFMINERDLSDYGSRGQARTAVLAIKLAELEWMHQTLGEWPILLLDEVVAELDAKRREYLQNHIQYVNQVLLTTTELSTLSEAFVNNATLWHVEMGSIMPMN